MFDSKQKTLFTEKENTQTSANNSFIKQGLKQSAKTTALGNGAVKFTTTGDAFVDQFGKLTNYRKPRAYKEVLEDMRLLWSINPLMALRFLFYIRLVTRAVSLPNGEKTETVQRGQGLKHEGIVRMLWLAMNEKNTFWKNIPYFIAAGSWKDIIQMLSFDLQYNGWEGRKLDWNTFGKLILAGLENPAQSNLLKKYLPQIRAKKNCKTLEAQADNLIAKWICSLLFGNKPDDKSGATYKAYRKLKTSGTAHEWQKLISQGKHTLIDFKTVHGRALAQMVSGKYLKNNGLEDKYTKWIEAQPIAKYTGYVYELLSPVKRGYNNKPLTKYQEQTINKQFLGLIETAKKDMADDDSGLLVVVDTSSSMTGMVQGLKISAYDVAKSMALYFSYLLRGQFAGTWMEFADRSKLKTWQGNTPVANLQNDRSEAYGGTNFQSVTAEFIRLFKAGVPIADFPKGILCLSDGCFNNAGNNKTNTRALLDRLKAAGFPADYIKNFKIILWDIPNGYYAHAGQTAFEDFADAPNLFHMSGLDGSAVAFITGTKQMKALPKTSEELFIAAMEQDLLNMLEI